MVNEIWYVIGAGVGAVFGGMVIASPIARRKLQARHPQLFEPIDRADILFQRTHVRITVNDVPPAPLQSRATTATVTVTATELSVVPEGPALLFFPDRFLLLRVPLSEVDVITLADNLSQAAVSVPLMNGNGRMKLWMLMNQYQEFADTVTAARANLRGGP